MPCLLDYRTRAQLKKKGEIALVLQEEDMRVGVEVPEPWALSPNPD